MKKAALTVEAALVTPIFVFTVLALIYVIMWFQKAESVQSRLVERARMASMVSSFVLPEEESEEVVLLKMYRMKLKSPLLPLLPPVITQRVETRKYIGVNEIGMGNNNPIVYLTPNGDVYHTFKSCTYINVVTNRIAASELETKRNLSGRKYIPCDVCGSGTSDYVYVSSYGYRYHVNNTCNTIVRNVIPIRLSEVTDRRCCSKCIEMSGD